MVGFSLRLSTIDQQKKFRACLSSLARIGPELMIEATANAICLRAINGAQSSCYSITIHANFFDSYDVVDGDIVHAVVLLKHLAAALRSPRATSIKLSLQEPQHELKVVLTTESGLRKSFGLILMESGVMKPNVDLDALPVRMLARTQEFARLLSGFQASQEEITFIAHPTALQAGEGPEGAARPKDDAIVIKSYASGARVKKDAVFTSVQVRAASCFDRYTGPTDHSRDITFNLKDFRAIVFFCEAVQADLEVRFDRPGEPLVVFPRFFDLQRDEVQGTDFDAVLVMATVMHSTLAAEEVLKAAATQQPILRVKPAHPGLGPGPGPSYPNYRGDNPLSPNPSKMLQRVGQGQGQGQGYGPSHTMGPPPVPGSSGYGTGHAPYNPPPAPYSHGPPSSFPTPSYQAGPPPPRQYQNNYSYPQQPQQPQGQYLQGQGQAPPAEYIAGGPASLPTASTHVYGGGAGPQGPVPTTERYHSIGGDGGGGVTHLSEPPASFQGAGYYPPSRPSHGPPGAGGGGGGGGGMGAGNGNSARPQMPGVGSGSGSGWPNRIAALLGLSSDDEEGRMGAGPAGAGAGGGTHAVYADPHTAPTDVMADDEEVAATPPEERARRSRSHKTGGHY